MDAADDPQLFAQTIACPIGDPYAVGSADGPRSLDCRVPPKVMRPPATPAAVAL